MLNKITDKVYQVKIPFPMGMNEVNCYLIKGQNGYTIIDTGFNTEEAKAVWTKILSDDTPVEKVVLTHAHPDHGGLAGWFKEQFGASVLLSRRSFIELKKIQSYFLNSNLNPIFSFLRMHGGPKVPVKVFQRSLEDYDFEPDILFEDHSKIQAGDLVLESIWTPGHTPDHFCFYNQEQQILFVGDHVVNSFNTIVLTEQEGENSLNDYFESLKSIENKSVLYVMAGHGELIGNLANRIAEIRANYIKKWQQIQGLIPKEGITAYEISQNVYGNKEITDRYSAAPFLQTITNLTYMESTGFIKKEERQGTVYFYCDS
ncbi:MBL fold metallo-hydrolase [Bacillus sp. OK048]|uniref:MBL fold metallo-hydrolase n=1 Tax=Bacillus sp. OK048 TaxID=1882761 RepID=UPI000885DE09|nr:MBL fold metallo-hydrolase [Bacillus sp. OK048]SDL96651.1 Glyoxylase, beta-lactamase superfamily II [Bacillus sp. OK048]